MKVNWYFGGAERNATAAALKWIEARVRGHADNVIWRGRVRRTSEFSDTASQALDDVDGADRVRGESKVWQA